MNNESSNDFWFAWPRSLFEHPALGGRYDARSAYAWLISHASWSPRRVATTRGPIDLRRGEVIAAADHLADVWGWSRKEVRSFLVRLVRSECVIRGPSKRPLPATLLIANFDSYVRADAKGAIERDSSGAIEGPLKGHTVQRNNDNKEESPPTPTGGMPLDCIQAFEAFNALALRVRIPQASKLTPDRRRKIAARLKDYGPDGWDRALGHIERSAFLTGNNDRGWRLTLDFLLQPGNFSKVHDCGYGNGRHAAAPAPVLSTKKTDAQIADENEAALREFGLLPEAST